MYLCSCEDENLMKASIVVVVCWQFRILFRHLRTFNSCNNFPNNHSPPCRLLSLSLSLPSIFPFVIIIKQATFCCDSHKFPQLSFISLSLSFAYREIHSLFFSRLSRKSSILEIEKNFQLVRFSSTRNSQTVKLFIRRHSAKLFKKYLEKKRKKLSISIKQKKSFSLNKIEENCCEKTLLKEGKKKFRTNLCIKSFIIFIITRGVRKRKLLYVLLLLMKKI